MKSPHLPAAKSADAPVKSSDISDPALENILAEKQATWRQATPADDAWILDLQARCFGPGRFARTAFRVREKFAIDPKLTLIAELDGQPVSCVLMTPISIGGVDGYMLGPLATDPDRRGKGAARLLVREVCRLALADGAAKYVMLVGDRSYYGPLGFVPSTPGAILFPGPVDPARVLVHSLDADCAQNLAGPLAAPSAGT